MIIYAATNETGDGTWHKFDGTLEEAKKIGLPEAREFNGDFGPGTRAAQGRPAGFFNLSGERQWEIDKNLGILDWSGNPED
jgi:hypothetical protein